jgi:ribonuclease HI
VRGVILDPRGSIEKETNNKVEWLALIKGLELAKEIKIEELAAIGDSSIVIREARMLAINNKKPITKMQHLLLCLAKEFKKIKSFHVLRAQNQQADGLANKGIGLSHGTLECDSKHRMDRSYNFSKYLHLFRFVASKSLDSYHAR